MLRREVWLHQFSLRSAEVQSSQQLFLPWDVLGANHSNAPQCLPSKWTSRARVILLVNTALIPTQRGNILTNKRMRRSTKAQRPLSAALAACHDDVKRYFLIFAPPLVTWCDSCAVKGRVMPLTTAMMLPGNQPWRWTSPMQAPLRFPS